MNTSNPEVSPAIQAVLAGLLVFLLSLGVLRLLGFVFEALGDASGGAAERTNASNRSLQPGETSLPLKRAA